MENRNKESESRKAVLGNKYDTMQKFSITFVLSSWCSEKLNKLSEYTSISKSYILDLIIGSTAFPKMDLKSSVQRVPIGHGCYLVPGWIHISEHLGQKNKVGMTDKGNLEVRTFSISGLSIMKLNRIVNQMNVSRSNILSVLIDKTYMQDSRLNR